MNKHSMVDVLVLSAVLLGTPAQAIAEQGPYVGGGLGETTFQHDASDFDDGSLAATGRVDDTDSGWKIFGGYDFNRHFAVEVGYTVLNKDFDRLTTFSGGLSDGSGRFAAGGVGIDIHEPRTVFAAAKGSWPVNERLDLFGKLGGHVWETELTTFDSTGIRENDESGIDPLAGIGLEYRFSGRWAVRAELERYMGVIDDDVDLASISLRYSFGRR